MVVLLLLLFPVRMDLKIKTDLFLDTPQPLYKTIVGVQANFRVSYPIRVISKVKCIGYIEKGVKSSHLGSNSDPCYIQNRVITNRVIKRFRCIWLQYSVFSGTKITQIWFLSLRKSGFAPLGLFLCDKNCHNSKDWQGILFKFGRNIYIYVDTLNCHNWHFFNGVLERDQKRN